MIDRIREIIDVPLMDNCAIIEIQNIFPEHLKIGELKLPAHDHFHFMVKDSTGWSICQSIGRKLSASEISMLRQYLEKDGWLSNPRANGQMLSISVNDYFTPIIEFVNSIPGARLNPNILQKKGNLYLCIEFQECCRTMVSDTVLDFVSEPGHTERSIVFFGKQEYGISKLLTFFEKEKDESFIMIRTVWEYDEETVRNENQGVFMNHGIFMPKFFAESGEVTMISRLDSNKILGNANCKPIDAERNLYEFSFKSHFMKDFFLNVIEYYSGPVFYRMICEEGKLENFFVVNKSTKDDFLRSLSKHWTMPFRKDHENRVELLEELEFNPHIF